jgi:RHS repeat-associated protein
MDDQAGISFCSGTVTYLVADLLGSVRGAVNSSGALTGATSYDALGNTLTAGGLSSTTPFGFAGGYTDPTGLIYLINRYYDPVLGRFISVDPQLADTQQPYAYADDDPVNRSDPDGLATVNLGGVASWAFQNYNTNMVVFSDNCTQFASSALHFGGGDPETINMAKPSDDHYWWAFWAGRYGYWHSHSFTVAHDLAEHLMLRGSLFLKSSPNPRSFSQARPGYIVFAALGGGGMLAIDHAGVVVAMSGGVPTVAQQTRNIVESLVVWKQKNPAAVFWIARPNADPNSN